MPSAEFTHEVSLTCWIGEAWVALQDASTWAGLTGVEEISDVDESQGGLRGFEFKARAAAAVYRGKARVTEAVPRRRMVMSITSSEVDGTITVELGPEPPRLIVSVELWAKGLVAYMFFGAISDAVAKGLPARMEAFAERTAVQ